MRQREIPASVGQRLLWLLHRSQGQGGTMNCPVVCRIGGRLDVAVLRAALDRLTARHESLRTTFVQQGHQLRQRIHEARPTELRYVDLSGATGLDSTSGVGRALREELRTSIDPTLWPSRTTLWRLDEETHVLCLNLHHLVTDTWSCIVLQRELAWAYEECQRRVSRLPRAGWQYSQFMAWQQRQIAGDDSRRHRDYWRGQLAGASAPLLPLRPANPRVPGRRCSVHAELDLDIVGRLQDMAGRHHTTLFVVMLSVFSTLLHHLTGQRDLATATLFANRIRPEVMNTVGFLANLVVLRTRLEGATTFGKVIERVRGTVLDGMSHQELPYHLVSHGTYASGGPRLDEVVFQMIGERIDETLCAGDLRIQGVVPEVEGRFDFELALIVRANGVGAKLDYREDRVDPPWADRFLSAYVAAAACAEPDAPLDALLDQRPLPIARLASTG